MDSDGSGEVELPEFIEIMTLTRESNEAEEELTPRTQAADQQEAQEEEATLPMNLLTIAFRRKKTMEAVMYNEGNMRWKLIQKGLLAEQRWG